ncbi:major facilitator superfamily domain-containing protein [Fennellomyces sp. T-0311]|nr:major facilitator superfamily domain-containing protein [Fennellomyces sp. T-0311]
MTTQDTVIKRSGDHNINRKDCLLYECSDDAEKSNLTLDSFVDLVDGKQAWVVALGVFGISLCPAIGNTWGVMKDHFQRTDAFSSGSDISDDLTLIGSLHQTVTYISALIANILYSRLGLRRVFVIALFTLSGGLILCSLVTSIWQLYLTFSLCTGFGVGSMSIIAFRILLEWFDKYKSTAFGIKSSMGSITSIFLPFVMNVINNTLGAPWTFRILALFFLVINASCIILIKSGPIAPKDNQNQNIVSGFVTVLSNLDFVILSLIVAIQICVFVVPLIVIASYATHIGLTSIQSSAIVSILGGMAAIGSVAFGAIGDKIGPVNTQIVCTMVSTICVFTLWMPAYNLAMLVAFATIFGLVYGSILVFMAPIAINIVGMDNYPSAVGVGALAIAIGTLGPFLITFVESKTREYQPFLSTKIIVGALYAVCFLLSIVLKLRLSRKVFLKV